MKRDKIITIPNESLRKPSKDVKVVSKGKVKRILNLFQLMYANEGIGLAAPQVGWNVNLFIVGIPLANKKAEEFAFVNPKITSYSSELITMPEGCLSIPELTDEVERPAEIEIEFLDLNGRFIKLHAKDLLARCIQHEFDHLSGILFTDRVGQSWTENVLLPSK